MGLEVYVLTINKKIERHKQAPAQQSAALKIAGFEERPSRWKAGDPTDI